MSIITKKNLSNEISALFKEIITKIENYIYDNTEEQDEVYKQMKMISLNISSIVTGSLENSTQPQLEAKIKDLQYKLERKIILEEKLKKEIEQLKSDNQATRQNLKLNHDLSISAQIIRKLKIEMKDKENNFKLKEMQYLQRIDELNKLVNSFEQKNRNNFSEEEIRTCELFPNTTKSVTFDDDPPNKFSKLKKIPKTKISFYRLGKSSSTDNLRLYDLYQKNKLSPRNKNYLVDNNIVSIKRIMVGRNKKIIPPFKYNKQSPKKYYSAFYS